MNERINHVLSTTFRLSLSGLAQFCTIETEMNSNSEADSARQKAVDAVFVPTQSSHGFDNKVQGTLLSSTEDTCLFTTSYCTLIGLNIVMLLAQNY